MSIESMSLALHHSEAKGATKLVLLGIANHDGDGGAWPSIATLAKYSGVTERRVQQIIQELVELGEITVIERRNTESNISQTNLYKIHLSCPISCDRTANHRVKPISGEGEAHFTQGVKPISPEPSLEPSIKPFSAETNKPTRMSNEATLTLSMNDFVRNNFPDINPLQEFEKFRDYWVAQPGVKGVKLDWEATWRNWIRKTDADMKRWNKPTESYTSVRERAVAATNEIIEEMKIQSTKATPPPECKHGNIIIKCRKCLLGID